MGAIQQSFGIVIALIALVGCKQLDSSPSTVGASSAAAASENTMQEAVEPRSIRIDLKNNDPLNSISLSVIVPTHLSEEKLVPVLVARVNKVVRECEGATSHSLGLQLQTSDGSVATVKPLSKGKVVTCVATKFDRASDSAFGQGKASFNMRIQPLSGVQGDD